MNESAAPTDTENIRFPEEIGLIGTIALPSRWYPAGMRKWAAFHEAGHTIACIVRGIPIDFVLIDRRGGVTELPFRADEEWMKIRNIDPSSVQSNMVREDLLVMAMAGPLAQFKAFTFSFGSPIVNIGSDTQAIKGLMDEWIPSNESREMTLRRVMADTQKLLSDYWPSVEALATALLERGRLSGEEAAQIVVASKK